MNTSSLHWNGAAYNCNMKLRQKSPGSNRCHDLHSFKEGVILLCQSIHETRQISDLHGSALFTISCNVSFRILTLYPSCKQFTLSICLRIYLLLAFALNMLFKVNFSFSMLRCFMLKQKKFKCECNDSVVFLHYINEICFLILPKDISNCYQVP